MNRVLTLMAIGFALVFVSAITVGPIVSVATPAQEPQATWTSRNGIVVYDDETKKASRSVGHLRRTAGPVG